MQQRIPPKLSAKLPHHNGYHYEPPTSTFLPGPKARVASAIC